MAGREKKGGPKKRTAASPPADVPSPPLQPAAMPPRPAGAPSLPPPTPCAPPRPAGAPSPPPSTPYAPPPAAATPRTAPSPRLTPYANPWNNYVNVLQQPHFPPMHLSGENSHFVGVAKSMNPPSPAAPPPKGTPARRVSIDIDADDSVETSSVVKKRFWSHDEEVKLASAWLNTSKDPIHGNDKKGDSFWGQITERFNKDAQPDRIRDTNQLKVHWSRLSTVINEFNGFWSSVCKMNKSGYSDDQLMDEAQKMFTQKNKKPFGHVHWWKILKNEPKWCTSVAQTDKDKSKAAETLVRGEPRPIGREAAKADRKGKRKAEQLMDGIVILEENINKIVEVAEERKKEREKATEAQLEISRINLEVVKGQKELKLLQVYNSLLTPDTSNMTDEEKTSRAKTLQWMQKKIMATDEEA